MSFKDNALAGAMIYYRYLRENQESQACYQVSAVRPSDRKGQSGCFILALADPKIDSTDALRIVIRENEYTPEQIRCIAYDEGKNELTVKPSPEFSLLLKTADPKSMQVLSDRTSPVRDLIDWYSGYGDRIAVPVSSSDVWINAGYEQLIGATKEQTAAMTGAMIHPFSYIFGAPGTGKTRVVLARLVTACILADKRVLVTAPSVRSLEQILEIILPVLQEEGIHPEDTVLRVGVPSAAFAAAWPGICEGMRSQKKLTGMQGQVRELEQVIRQIQSVLAFFEQPEGAGSPRKELIDFVSYYSSEDAELERLYTRLQEIWNERSSVSEKVKEEQGVIEKNTAESDSKNERLRQLTEEKKQCSGIHRMFRSQQLKEIEEEIGHIRNLQETLRQESETREKTIDAFHDQDVALMIEESETVEKIDQIKDRLKAQQVPILTATIEEVQADLDRAVKRYREFDSGSQVKAGQCLLLACTIDDCIAYLRPDDGPAIDHVFLDDAGACPVIKAAPLLAYHCPVTLLGDHMQLPPVCEMNTKGFIKDQQETAVYWAQSAVYLESALERTPKQFMQEYMRGKEAPFWKLVVFPLNRNFRYGPVLASVLAGDVYSEKYAGNPDIQTELVCLPGIKSSADKKRESFGEAEQIVRYLWDHPEEDAVVLTPYKDQKVLLREIFRMNELNPERVMTVQECHDREEDPGLWDTVLFSVADTYQDRWLTDSTNRISRGRNVINTAICRARRKVVLVCDTQSWSEGREQLIGKLILAAEGI